MSRTEGIVLNVGCHVDPANLKSFGDRVINCDIAIQPGYDYEVDRLFDVRLTWPFEDDTVELVVFGDILEHLYDVEIISALQEARRVADKVCITVPHDTLLQDKIDSEADCKAHCNTIDRDKIGQLLAKTGWQINEFHIILYEYEITSEGYLVEAK